MSSQEKVIIAESRLFENSPGGETILLKISTISTKKLQAKLKGNLCFLVVEKPHCQSVKVVIDALTLMKQ